MEEEGLVPGFKLRECGAKQRGAGKAGGNVGTKVRGRTVKVLSGGQCVAGTHRGLGGRLQGGRGGDPGGAGTWPVPAGGVGERLMGTSV